MVEAARFERAIRSLQHLGLPISLRLVGGRDRILTCVRDFAGHDIVTLTPGHGADSEI